MHDGAFCIVAVVLHGGQGAADPYNVDLRPVSREHSWGNFVRGFHGRGRAAHHPRKARGNRRKALVGRGRFGLGKHALHALFIFDIGRFYATKSLYIEKLKP